MRARSLLLGVLIGAGVGVLIALAAPTDAPIARVAPTPPAAPLNLTVVIAWPTATATRTPPATRTPGPTPTPLALPFCASPRPGETCVMPHPTLPPAPTATPYPACPGQPGAICRWPTPAARETRS